MRASVCLMCCGGSEGVVAMRWRGVCMLRDELMEMGMGKAESEEGR